MHVYTDPQHYFSIELGVCQMCPLAPYRFMSGEILRIAREIKGYEYKAISYKLPRYAENIIRSLHSCNL